MRDANFRLPTGKPYIARFHADWVDATLRPPFPCLVCEFRKDRYGADSALSSLVLWRPMPRWLCSILFLLRRFLSSWPFFMAPGTGVMLYLLFHPRNQWLVANRSRVEREGCVALTFDDGPDPVDTPKLLDLLREKSVKATFFVVGKRADAASGDRAPRLGRRAPDRQSHLVAPTVCSVFSRRGGCGPRSSAARRAFAASVASGRAISAPRLACVIPFCASSARGGAGVYLLAHSDAVIHSSEIPVFLPGASWTK